MLLNWREASSGISGIYGANDALRCSQMLWDVLKYSWMLWNTPGCSWMLLDARRCFRAAGNLWDSYCDDDGLPRWSNGEHFLRLPMIWKRSFKMDSEGFWGISRDSEGFWRILRDFEGFWGVLRGSEGFWGILEWLDWFSWTSSPGHLKTSSQRTQLARRFTHIDTPTHRDTRPIISIYSFPFVANK